MKKELFPHQKEALKKLDLVYHNSQINTSGLLVIPTGGGKTFIAVNWLRKNYLRYKARILWFAQSIELLNQAENTIREIIPEITAKVISSNVNHSKVEDISMNDELLIISSMTAISIMKKDDNKLESYLKNHLNELFIIIVDEAHHSPAKGNRLLLHYLESNINSVWILGLTATPTYTNQNKRGWLWKIYKSGVIYEVKKTILQKQKILAKERYIHKRTPVKINISDEDFDSLVKLNRDVPEKIVEELAENKERNDYIISELLKNKNEYGKTIIFLDRWYQCLYFKDKLLENGLKAETIYSQQDRNINKSIIEDFRNNQIDILLNVRMVTEGVDVPDTKTVFITRQTTSYILLQQMIGRALRGEKAGGKKEYANIVLFGDSWNKSIAWAKPDDLGMTIEDEIKIKSLPIKRIPELIISKFISKMQFSRNEEVDYGDMIPLGWYEIEYISYNDNDGINNNIDFILVYNNEKQEWENFISNAKREHNSQLEKYELDMEKIKEYIKQKKVELGNVVDCSDLKIVGLLRAIAQGNIPHFIMLECKKDIDIGKIIKLVYGMSEDERKEKYMEMYNTKGSVWKIIFSSFEIFNDTIEICLNQRQDISYMENNFINIQEIVDNVNKKALTIRVKERDEKKCICCGLKNSIVPLRVYEIFNLGVEGFCIDNMQTLCSRCAKLSKHINFLKQEELIDKNRKLLGVSLEDKYLKDVHRIQASIQASINISFGASICKGVMISRRKNSKIIAYNTCMIFLNIKANIPLLMLYSNELLYYIQNELNQDHIKKLEVQIEKN